MDQLFEFEVGIAELSDTDQMLGELAAQLQDHRGDRGRGFRGVQLAAIATDHVVGELPEFGGAD